MTITHIFIHRFRNITQTELILSDKFNFLVGKNGSGKTNFLEALYMLGHGRAFRHQQINRIIQYAMPELAIHGKIKLSNNRHCLGIAKSRKGTNRIKIDGNEGVKTANLAQLLPIQLITPEGFDLLAGGPKYRRAFLDWGCFHHFPLFLNVWNTLRRLIRQRNNLLRQVTSYALRAIAALGQRAYWDCKDYHPLSPAIHRFYSA